MTIPPLRNASEQLADARAASAFVDDVTTLVVSLLSKGDGTMERVATHLGISRRTLQRRLHNYGVFFNDIVTNTRLELSTRYIADPSRSLTDVALALGYSDLSAFSRAFRRWTGRSPIAFRRDLLRTVSGNSGRSREGDRR